MPGGNRDPAARRAASAIEDTGSTLMPVGVDEERILVGAVVGAAVLDHTQAARRDLIVDAVVEQDHGIRDVLLESLPGQQTLRRARP